MTVALRRRGLSGVGVAATAALLVGALNAPTAAAQDTPAPPPPAAAPAQGEAYVPPAQVNTTPSGSDPTGQWTRGVGLPVGK